MDDEEDTAGDVAAAVAVVLKEDSVVEVVQEATAEEKFDDPDPIHGRQANND